MGGSYFRGAFKARGTRHAQAEEGGTLRLAQVCLTRQEIFQKLAHRLALRPFLRAELRTFRLRRRVGLLDLRRPRRSLGAAILFLLTHRLLARNHWSAHHGRRVAGQSKYLFEFLQCPSTLLVGINVAPLLIVFARLPKLQEEGQHDIAQLLQRLFGQQVLHHGEVCGRGDVMLLRHRLGE